MEDRGQPIKGSRFYREFCSECEEPMRVTKEKVGVGLLCEQCNPKHKGCSSPSSPVDRDGLGSGAVSLQSNPEYESF